MASERLKRPELERSEPIRSFDGLFGRAARTSADAGPTETAGSRRERAPAGSERGESDDASGSPRERTSAARAVAIGYEIMDDYLRQGRALARAMSSTSPFAGSPTAQDGTRLAERMSQAAFDFAATWLEYFQAVAAPLPPRPSSRAETPGVGAGAFNMPEPPRASGGAVGERAAAAPDRSGLSAPEAVNAPFSSSPRVSIRIRSKRRTQVSVDVKPRAAALSLFAHDLRARDLSLPRIAGILVETNAVENLVIVGIDVSDEQPAATYSGIILDEHSNLPQGTVSVCVLDA